MNSEARDHQFIVTILADIHGNLAALLAVLNHLARQSYDRMVIAGDLLLNGPQPAATLETIRALDVPTIYGNADRYVCDRTITSPDVEWVRRAIGAKGIAYLARLPFDERITPPGGTSPDDDLLIVHATPTDIEAVLTVQPDPFGLLSVTPEDAAQRLLGGVQANLIVSGHVHYASFGVVCNRRFASIGSIGFPFDGDCRAAYAKASWDGCAWQLQHDRIPYDHLQVAEEVLRSGAPFAQQSAQRLLHARFRP
jgi:hypothetical protein